MPTVKITIRVSPATAEHLKKKAKEKHLSQSKLADYQLSKIK